VGSRQRKTFEQPEVALPREPSLASSIESPVPQTAGFSIEGINPIEIARQTKIRKVSAQNAAQPSMLQYSAACYTSPNKMPQATFSRIGSRQVG
jgi:hypothetical protein